MFRLWALTIVLNLTITATSLAGNGNTDDFSSYDYTAAKKELQQHHLMLQQFFNNTSLDSLDHAIKRLASHHATPGSHPNSCNQTARIWDADNDHRLTIYDQATVEQNDSYIKIIRLLVHLQRRQLTASKISNPLLRSVYQTPLDQQTLRTDASSSRQVASVSSISLFGNFLDLAALEETSANKPLENFSARSLPIDWAVVPMSLLFTADDQVYDQPNSLSEIDRTIEKLRARLTEMLAQYDNPETRQSLSATDSQRYEAGGELGLLTDFRQQVRRNLEFRFLLQADGGQWLTKFVAAWSKSWEIIYLLLGTLPAKALDIRSLPLLSQKTHAPYEEFISRASAATLRLQQFAAELDGQIASQPTEIVKRLPSELSAWLKELHQQIDRLETLIDEIDKGRIEKTHPLQSNRDFEKDLLAAPFASWGEIFGVAGVSATATAPSKSNPKSNQEAIVQLKIFATHSEKIIAAMEPLSWVTPFSPDWSWLDLNNNNCIEESEIVAAHQDWQTIVDQLDSICNLPLAGVPGSPMVQLCHDWPYLVPSQTSLAEWLQSLAKDSALTLELPKVGEFSPLDALINRANSQDDSRPPTEVMEPLYAEYRAQQLATEERAGINFSDELQRFGTLRLADKATVKISSLNPALKTIYQNALDQQDPALWASWRQLRTKSAIQLEHNRLLRLEAELRPDKETVDLQSIDLELAGRLAKAVATRQFFEHVVLEPFNRGANNYINEIPQSFPPQLLETLAQEEPAESNSIEHQAWENTHKAALLELERLGKEQRWNRYLEEIGFTDSIQTLYRLSTLLGQRGLALRLDLNRTGEVTSKDDLFGYLSVLFQQQPTDIGR